MAIAAPVDVALKETFPPPDTVAEEAEASIVGRTCTVLTDPEAANAMTPYATVVVRTEAVALDVSYAEKAIAPAAVTLPPEM